MTVREEHATPGLQRGAPRRRLSAVRVTIAVGVLAAVVFGVVRVVQRADRGDAALPAPWFAPYVDATLTPEYPFEDPAASPAPQVVLGFVVARSPGSCEPSWGAAYGLDDAATSLDLDRRWARLRSSGRDAIVSFGGAANQELAVSCTDDAALQRAYRDVLDRYDVGTIDLDLEGAALDDAPSLARRATAIAAVQRDRTAAGRALAVWLTLPVDTDGLTAKAQAALTAMTTGGVTVSGVNLMTMNYGGGDLRTDIERSLGRAVGQVDTAYRAAGVKLTREQVWRRIGATPMIGLNDTVSDRFDVDTASWLVEFARDRGMGRLSMWSINRDTPCGPNVDATRPSPYCSGVPQQALAFTDALGAFGRGASTPEPSSDDADVTAAGAPAARTPVADDPATSPYPVWSEQRSYRQGTKVVWHGNVYVALWYTNGEVPDGATVSGGPAPWRLVGPVLPGERPPVTTTIAPGTYAAWDPQVAYTKGQRVQVGGIGYQAKWWTRGDPPDAEVANDWDTPWQALAGDDRGEPSSTPSSSAVTGPASTAPASTAPAPPAASAPLTQPTVAVVASTSSASTAASPSASSTATGTGGVTCADQPLVVPPFADGSWELTPAARAVLDTVAEQLSPAVYARVTVIGRSDHRPSSPVDNDTLSLLRAQAAAAYLREAGVGVPVDVDARSTRDPLAGGTVDANRTVEVRPTCR